ncbi:carbohydrate ABC transporter permease [Demequina aestuarii]|uniref:carbohydrate ABC transporter permease n=1 Tax=Demequina aestuarii TaxID=327095 RepID=UPI0009FF159D|nr:sugar ABC transporter permease [Demequina aestuarii]
MTTATTMHERRPERPPGESRSHVDRRRRRIHGSPWVAVAFAAPLIVYLIAFYAYPLIRSIDLSVHDYNIRAFVQGNAEFVGLENFANVVSSPLFPQALWNTFLFVFVSLVFQYSIGLALAVFFKRRFPLSGVLRAMFLIPWLLPLIVSSSTWAWMMNSDAGVLNSFLGVVGIDPVNWLTSPETSLLSVIIANIWLGIPFNLVILYSGLQNIPEEVYEAAALDGAGPFMVFWRVTFPLLRPVSAITILLGLVYTLKVVDVVWIMSKGGPANSSLTLAVWSYREAFGTGQPDFSPAAAIGNILIVIALVFGLAYVNLQRKVEQ